MLALVYSFSNSTTCLVPRRWRLHAACIATTMPARTVLRAVRVAGIGAILVTSPPVFAAEWSMIPSLQLMYEYNDNFRLALQPDESIHGIVFSPRLEMGVHSAVWGITGLARVTRTRYSGEEGLDRDTENFGFGSFYMTERSNFTLNASRANDTTIPEEPDDPDLGRVTVQRSRRTETVAPAWNWSITERAQLQLSYQLSETSYPDSESIGLFGYKNEVATATWSYMLSPRSQFFLTGNYSKFRVPEQDLISQIPASEPLFFTAVSSVDSKTPSFRIGMSHSFSNTMQGKLMLGRRKTSTERNTYDCFRVLGGYACLPAVSITDNSGTTFSSDLSKQFKKLSLTATASRDLAVSGAGAETETDLLNIRLDYAYTTRLRGVLTVGGSEARLIAEAVGTSSASTNLRQYHIQPALHWNWTREADLSLAYRYRHLKREGEDQAAQSRAIYLTLIYTWTKLSISR